MIGMKCGDPCVDDEGQDEDEILMSWIARDLRAIMTCQWFLIALSVRPGKRRAIRDHLVPYAWRAARSCSSSSLENASRLSCGSSWLIHRSLQLFPISLE